MTNKKIKIHFSQEDLEELMAGETFDWTFDGVDVHLYMGDEEDEEQTECENCGEMIPITRDIKGQIVPEDCPFCDNK